MNKNYKETMIAVQIKEDLPKTDKIYLPFTCGCLLRVNCALLSRQSLINFAY